MSSVFLQLCPSLRHDALFLDPPWGGVDYKKLQELPLFLSGKALHTVCLDALDCCRQLRVVVIKCPTNFPMRTFVDLVRGRAGTGQGRDRAGQGRKGKRKAEMNPKLM